MKMLVKNVIGRVCPVCEKVIDVDRGLQISDNNEIICANCATELIQKRHLKVTDIQALSVQEIKEELNLYRVEVDSNNNKVSVFNPIKKIGNYLWIDEKNQLFALPKVVGFTFGIDNNTRIYSFDEIIDYELIEDGFSVTKGGVSIGKGLVGGALFGVVGAVVGGSAGKRKTSNTCTSFKVKITLKSVNEPLVNIDLLKLSGNTKVKTDSSTYKRMYKDAEQIIASLDAICVNMAVDTIEPDVSNTKTIKEEGKSVSVADEIKKLKDLLDCGAITEEEFISAKKKLLG